MTAPLTPASSYLLVGDAGHNLTGPFLSVQAVGCSPCPARSSTDAGATGEEAEASVLLAERRTL